MLYILLAALSSACATAQSTLAKFTSSKGKTIEPMRFNFFKLGAAFVFFALISIATLSFHPQTAVYAACYALLFFGSNIFGYLALMHGSMALTSLIVSYNVIIPCLHGIFFLGEKMRIFQGVGLILLLASMAIIMRPGKNNTINKKWFMYVALTFVCNGFCSIIQKLHQTAFPGEYCNEFTVYSLFVCAVLFFVLSKPYKREKSNGAVKYAVFAGILMGAANYITLVLSASVNSSVLFPVVSVCSAIFIVTASKIFFKDKLSAVQLVGICMGVISVLLIK